MTSQTTRQNSKTFVRLPTHMEDRIIENVCLGEGDDFSCNARSDILGKYSRFHGKADYALKCNSEPDVKYIDSFRELLFQISPNYITCTYKKMFEAAALSNLRNIDEYAFIEDDKDCAADFHRLDTCSEPSSPRALLNELVDSCNSCSYTGTHASQNTPKWNCNADFCGWDICQRPHSVGGTGYKRRSTGSARDRHHGRFPNCRVTSPAIHNFPGSLRPTRGRHVPSPSRSAAQTYTRPKDPGKQDSLSSASSRGSTSAKSHKRFKHFKRNSSYMDHYRDEYTYRRLLEARDAKTPTDYSFLCSCGNPSCAGFMTTTGCIQRWYPNQSHMVRVKESASVCVTSGIPTPKRTPVLKKRPAPRRPPPYVLQVPVGDTSQKKPRPHGCYKLGMPRMEFFASPLKVNSYKPGCSASSSASRVAAVPVNRAGVLAGVHSPSIGSTNQLNRNMKGSF